MKKVLLIMLLLIISVGCANQDKLGAADEKSNNQEGMNKYERENYVPVQEYTGEGYELEGARKETGEIANAHRDEVEEAVENYFQNEYQTEVKVHNFVSAVDAVSVFVESIGDPHFYTYVVVPVDIKNQQVMTDNVFSEGKQVDRAIGAGLYAMAFEEEFRNLDDYLKDIVEEYPIVGRTKESVANVGGNPVATPYYRFTPAGDVIKQLSDKYIESPEMTKKELRTFLEENEFDPEDGVFVIELFMKETGMEPDAELFEEITLDIEKIENLPPGTYAIDLNDNFIDKTDNIGTKDNTLELLYPDWIVKD